MNGINRKALRVSIWWDQEQKQWSAKPWVWISCGDQRRGGGLLQLTLLFPLFALIIFCRTACLLVSYIPWPLTSWYPPYSPFNPASPLLRQCPTNHECGLNLYALWYLSWGNLGGNLFYDWHPEGLRGLPRTTAASGWGVPYNKPESLVTWFCCSDISTAFCRCPFRLKPNIGPIFCPGVIFCTIMKLNSLLWLWVLTVSQVSFITNW